MTHIPNLQTLVLNADMQPLSWGPLSVWSWQDALVAVLQERVIPVINYDVEVHSTRRAFQIPSVVALKRFHKRRKVALPATMSSCATGSAASTAAIPAGQGIDVRPYRAALKGRIYELDQRGDLLSVRQFVQGRRSLKQSGLRLRCYPVEPTPHQIDEAAKWHVSRENLHRTWLDFLYWDADLEA